MRILLKIGLKDVEKTKVIDLNIKNVTSYESELPILKELENFVYDSIKVKTLTNKLPYQIAINLDKARIVRHFKEAQFKSTSIEDLTNEIIWNNLRATYVILRNRR